MDTLASFWRALIGRPPVPSPADTGTRILPAYAALARYRLGATDLPIRLRLLVAQLAADRSGCQWCIERCRHTWREAQLPLDLLQALEDFAASPLFSETERAALTFAEAITRYTDAGGGMPAEPLELARRHFSEREVAALTETVAAMHFFNPITGALGADVTPAPESAWHVRTGSAARNLWL